MIVRFFGGWDFDAERRHPRRRPRPATRKGVPMGGDLRGAARQGADVPRRRDEGSDQRQPRPHPDHQGLARRKDGKLHEKIYDVVWGARTGARPSRTASCRRWATRSTSPNATWTNTIGDPELISRLEGPGLRSGAARLLLRARARDPDAALDRLRREAIRGQDDAEGADDDAGAGVHVADLVHAALTGCARCLAGAQTNPRRRRRASGLICRCRTWRKSGRAGPRW